jgi:maltose O-acetyltransferase
MSTAEDKRDPQPEDEPGPAPRPLDPGRTYGPALRSSALPGSLPAHLGELVRRWRIWKYRSLSTCRHVSGSPIVLQPVLFLGEGSIALGRDVEFGWRTSASFYSGYCHIEASTPASSIELGDGAQVNNNAVIKSEGPGIEIGARALLGSGVTIYDSDFHDLHPDRRRGGQPLMARVELGENVFIGDHVTILKGVRIGAHSVIGTGSVVTSSIPAGVIAAGNPARVIRALDDEQPAKDRLAVVR